MHKIAHIHYLFPNNATSVAFFRTLAELLGETPLQG